MGAWNKDRLFQDELPLFQWKISCFFFVIGFLIRSAMREYLKVTLFPCTQMPSQENAAIHRCFTVEFVEFSPAHISVKDKSGSRCLQGFRIKLAPAPGAFCIEFCPGTLSSLLLSPPCHKSCFMSCSCS